MFIQSCFFNSCVTLTHLLAINLLPEQSSHCYCLADFHFYVLPIVEFYAIGLFRAIEHELTLYYSACTCSLFILKT